MKIPAVVGFLLLITGLCIAQSNTPGAATSTAPSKATTAKGRFTPHCNGASFRLSKVDGLSSQEELNFILRQSFTWWVYRPEEVWTSVYAERCQSSGKCEQVPQAKLWLDKTAPDAKEVSGKYEVVLGGQRLAGIFHVKYQKEGKRWLCE